MNFYLEKNKKYGCKDLSIGLVFASKENYKGDPNAK